MTHSCTVICQLAGQCLDDTRERAMGCVLIMLKSRLSFFHTQIRDGVLELARKYNLTAEELLEFAEKKVRENS